MHVDLIERVEGIPAEQLPALHKAIERADAVADFLRAAGRLRSLANGHNGHAPAPPAFELPPAQETDDGPPTMAAAPKQQQPMPPVVKTTAATGGRRSGPLSADKLLVLEFIADNEPAPSLRIARGLGITAKSITWIYTSKYVTKTDNGFELTDAGRAAIAAGEAPAAKPAATKSPLTPDQLRVLQFIADNEPVYIEVIHKRMEIDGASTRFLLDSHWAKSGTTGWRLTIAGKNALGIYDETQTPPDEEDDDDE